MSFVLPTEWFGHDAAASNQPSKPPWMNAALTPDERADTLQAQMTLDEELQLVKGYYGANTATLPYVRPAPDPVREQLPGTAGFVPGIPRLGIPALIESDGSSGIANNRGLRAGDRATALPSGIMMAATWNPDLAHAAGSVIGVEARGHAFNLVLNGAVNLAREPRGGRTFEYAGEDPLLAGTMVGAEIGGIQSQHVISTVKHFALNDQESGRFVLRANIGESAARQSDLLAFQIAIERGDPGAVMCAFNRYRDTYACENADLLNGTLKGEWHYKGWVLSDWGAVHSTVAAANAGLDQQSASGFDKTDFFGAPLKQAIVEGKVSRARLHDMVHRILRAMFANGLFDFLPAARSSVHEANRAVAEQIAEQGIVLLKNAGAVLPLRKDVRSIAVIGAHADLGVLSGGGSSQVTPIGYDDANEFPVGGAVQILPNGAQIRPRGVKIYDPPSPVAAIQKALPRAKVTYNSGDNVQAALRLARHSDVAIIFAEQWMTEGRDVPNLNLPGNQDALISAVAAVNPRTIVVLETGGPVVMPWLEQVPAVLEGWYSGSGGASAIAHVLFGEVNPSGKLPITFPASEQQLPRPVLPSGRAPFDVNYIEGADVGYRWFQRQNLKPLFPFGYGLSYSTFHLDGVKVTGGDTMSVSADVTNDGPMPGLETVQLYAVPPAQSGRAAPRLVGWTKLDLRPGETRRVSVTAELRVIADFDETRRVWHIPEGDYAVAVGTSSGLVPSLTVHLTGKDMAS